MRRSTPHSERARSRPPGSGAATASSYAASGLVDWRLALVFILGGLAGGLGGAAIGGRLANRKALLGRIFAGVVITVGLYVLLRGFLA